MVSLLETGLDPISSTARSSYWTDGPTLYLLKNGTENFHQASSTCRSFHLPTQMYGRTSGIRMVWNGSKPSSGHTTGTSDIEKSIHDIFPSDQKVLQQQSHQVAILRLLTKVGSHLEATSKWMSRNVGRESWSNVPVPNRTLQRTTVHTGFYFSNFSCRRSIFDRIPQWQGGKAPICRYPGDSRHPPETTLRYFRSKPPSKGDSIYPKYDCCVCL